MRVISGNLRGREIKAVPGNNTRPTTDKVKESVFNMIGPYFDGGQALDLFGGSGNLGIEAISRGIDHCIFVDKEVIALKVIKENLERLKINDQADVYKSDYMRALQMLKSQNKKFDLVFLDPPYAKQQINEIIEYMSSNDLLNIDATIVCEYARGDEIINEFKNVYERRKETYGTTTISIFRVGEED